MNGSLVSTPEQRSGAAVASVLADLASTRHRALIVDSPPGAGKSTLVMAAAIAHIEETEKVAIVAQTNNQVDDLIVRLHQTAPEIPLGRLCAQDYDVSAINAAVPGLELRTRPGEMLKARIILGTAAKWARQTDFHCGLAILDEAYQMRSDLLLALDAERFARLLLVGDPGQLDPFTTVETERWSGLFHDPTTSAISVLLANHPNLPVHRLPISWRLPASAAPVVAKAFYPFLGFDAGTSSEQRRLRFLTAGLDERYDSTLDVAARSGWALHELPRLQTPRTDPVLAGATAGIAQRLLLRGAVTACERQPDEELLQPEDIAVGVAHRDQAAAVRHLLRNSSVPGASRITVDTANRLQGREYQVTVIVHPLSGRHDTSEFHLEAGRLCVLASRHRHACIVVARCGITDLLESHASTEPVHLDLPVKFPDGWQAHQALLEHLESVKITVG
jgi:hypothetical protein